MTRPRLLAAVALALVVSACGSDSESVDPAAGAGAQIVEEGSELYATYCASCHGANLEGHPDWRTPNADGSYNPPPHDVTGHTWHHGDLTLVQLISDGSPFPQSQMPPFGEILTVEQVLSILAFVKASWGEEERAFQSEVTDRELTADS